MARQFTETENQAFYDAEKILRQQGLDVDGPNSQANAKLVLDYFQNQQPQVPVTVENILWLVGQLRSHLVWLGPAQLAYNSLEMTESARKIVNDWLAKHKALATEGEQGFTNALAAAKFLLDRRYSISAVNLDHAIGNIAANSRIIIFWRPQRTERASLLHNHSKDVLEPPKSDGHRYTKDGRINHAYSEPDTPANTPHVVDAWEKICHDLTRNGTHGQQVQLRSVLERARNSGMKWRQVHAELESAKRQFENKLVRR